MKKLKQRAGKRTAGHVTDIIVRKRAVPNAPHLARLHAGGVVIRASIGKTGLSHRKREGDGASPVGRFGLKRAFFRPDRLNRLGCLVGVRPLSRSVGWCDDPSSGLYNRQVMTGLKASHEKLWRDDGVYNVVIPTSHNERPRIVGAGSAIFLHLARPGYAPTEGCVAISLPDMRRLLPRLSRNVRLIIGG